ncbi:MAG: molecular chaperone [Solirubrobacterales bacterium]
MPHALPPAAGALALLLASTPAAWSAAPLEIQPTSLTLSETTGSADLAVTNGRSVPTAFEVRAFAWTQGPKGEIQLAPSEEIRVQPGTLTVAPNETGIVKVQISAPPPAALETTYRVSLRELPDRPAEDGETIKVLNAVSIPVFRPPAAAVSAGTIEIPGIDDGRLPFTVRNGGSGHVFVEAVSVTGRDAKGKVVFDLNRRGWYVLAEGRRDFDFALARKDCLKTSTMIVRARLLDGGTWEGTTPVLRQKCGNGRKTEFAETAEAGSSTLSLVPPGR